MYVNHITLHPSADSLGLAVENLHCGVGRVSEGAVCQFKRNVGRGIVINVGPAVVCSVDAEVFDLPAHVVRSSTKVKSNLKSFLFLSHFVVLNVVLLRSLVPCSQVSLRRSGCLPSRTSA